MIEAIIFDFDGVIVDSEPLHYRAFLQTAKNAGVDIDFSYDEYLSKYVGFDDREGFREMLLAANGKTAASPDLSKRVESLCESKKDVFASIVHQGFETIPGVLDFIATLPASFPIAIASGATRSDIDLILAKLGIAPRFNPIISASDVERSKPDPATYRLALQGLIKRTAKLDPSRVLAIEDTAAGIESARGAGLQTLGIKTTTDGSPLAKANRVIAGFPGLTLEQLRKWYG